MKYINMKEDGSGRAVMKDIWKILREKNEFTHCIECNKRMWVFWNKSKEEMDQCAPCYFEHEK